MSRYAVKNLKEAEDVVRIAPEVVRGFDAGPDGLELIAIGGEKPEGGDGHPVRDRWPAE